MFAKNKNNKNKGQVLVLVALSMVVIIGFAALAIDVAYFYHTKNQLQGAADAAALAGAALLDPSKTPNQQDDARAEAARIASLNVAAKDPVILASDGGNVPELPEPLPDTNDITVGNWDGSNYIRGGTPVNAVEVRARRTAGSKDQTFPGGTETNKGAIKTFFGGIFNIAEVNISATAIAALFPAEVLPIAVNEYWLHRDAKKGSGTPYPAADHLYPNSFVRSINVSGGPLPSGQPSPNWTPNGGKIFGILGANANVNDPPIKINGYLYPDSRSRDYSGNGVSWFDVKEKPRPEFICTTCGSSFKQFTAYELTGTISPAKFDDTSLDYLFNGFEENYPLPTAVKEQYNSDYTVSPSVTSTCPFATVPVFSGSGNAPLNKSDPITGQPFYDAFPKGKKVIALVYDGTMQPDPIPPKGPDSVTIIGYVLLKIDGYHSTEPKNLKLSAGSTGSQELGPTGNTMYGHALLPMVEPDSSGCDETFFNDVKNLQIQGASIRLVK